MALAYYHRYLLFDNTGFFTGNLGQGIPQDLRMLQTDICNDRKHGSNNIGAVQPPAQARFDYGYIYPGFGKSGKGQQQH